MMTPARLESLSTSFALRWAGAAMLAVLLAAPAVAQGEVEFRHPNQLAHPILGSITDDGGPFLRVNWGLPTVHTQWSLPPEDEKLDGGASSSAVVRFNPVSGRAVTVWTVNGDALFSRFGVGGWSAPHVLAAGVDRVRMALASDNGTVHVVYSVPDDGVWHRQVRAGRDTWSPAKRISRVGESATDPTIVIHGSVVTVAYEARVGETGARNIVVAQIPVHLATTAEADYDHTVVSLSHFADSGHVRLDSEGPGGRLLVRWLVSDELFGWAIQSPLGIWGAVGVEVLPGTASTERQRRTTRDLAEGRGR